MFSFCFLPISICLPALYFNPSVCGLANIKVEHGCVWGACSVSSVYVLLNGAHWCMHITYIIFHLCVWWLAFCNVYFFWMCCYRHPFVHKYYLYLRVCIPLSVNVSQHCSPLAPLAVALIHQSFFSALQCWKVCVCVCVSRTRQQQSQCSLTWLVWWGYLPPSCCFWCTIARTQNPEGFDPVERKTQKWRMWNREKVVKPKREGDG